jgi:MFS family permease
VWAWLARRLGVASVPRRGDLDDRGTVLALLGRFTDELASGLLIVLMPSLRARAGLSVAQVGWLWQVLFSAAALVEPITSAAIDVVRRRPLLVWGAAGWGAALLVVAAAPSFWWLLVGFALAGVASGPLTTTADVVLVEGHPDAVERITGRSTVLDTTGALLAPVGVAVAVWAGVDSAVLFGVTGLAILGYALALTAAVVPAPAVRADGTSSVAHIRTNVGAILRDPSARLWLAALVVQELLGLSELFEPVWLRDVVGASQPLVAVHVAAGMVASLLTLLALDRLLLRFGTVPLLIASCAATLVLYPAWLLVPGYAAKLLLVVPRDAAMAPLWPILRARTLAAVPGASGTTSALYSLLGFVPLQAAFGWVASSVGLTPTMGVVHVGATVALGLLVARLRDRPEDGAATGTAAGA